MPSEKATALVLRTVEFSETSLVVTLFTREFGKIGALAKGARRLKSPFESALDLLALCRIVFLRKQADSLDLLTEAKLLRRFRIPPRGLGALYAAYYVAELLGELTDDDDPLPSLFDAADETLQMLAAGDDAAHCIAHFELTALRLLGHIPSLDCCVGCGTAIDAGRGRVSFGLQAGGVLCESCRPEHRAVASVDANVLAALAALADARPEVWRTVELPGAVAGPLRGLLSNYVAHLIGRKTRMHHYMAALFAQHSKKHDASPGPQSVR